MAPLIFGNHIFGFLGWLEIVFQGVGFQGSAEPLGFKAVKLMNQF